MPVNRGADRSGFVAAVLVNAVMLYVVNHLVEWGWPAFLTEDFTDLLPLLNVSIATALAFNVAYLVGAGNRFRAFGEMVSAALGLAVAIRTSQIFPFDFSGYSGFPWVGLTRVIVVLAIIGTAVGASVQMVKLITGAPQRR